MVSVWWLIDTSGSVVGLPLNFLLLWTIYRVKRDKIMAAAYQHMLLASGIFDTFFDIIELCTQHVSVGKS